MTSYAFGASNSGTWSGTIADLGGGYGTAYIGVGAVMGSSDLSPVVGTGSRHYVVVNGVLVGMQWGIVLGSNRDVDSLNRVEVSKTGEVYGSSYAAMDLVGYSSTLKNAGHLYGGTEGVNFYGNQAPLDPVHSSTLSNSGTIEGGDFAGVMQGGNEKLVISNSGTIKGVQNSFVDTGDGVSIITNTGVMTGKIALGAGADKYDGHAGHHSGGAIDGGVGNDTIFGGSDNDKIFGGNNDDSLAGNGGNDNVDGGSGRDSLDGGLGADVLTGAGGSDFYRFSTKLGSGNVDKIVGFSHADDTIRLAATIFQAVGSGLESAEFYAAAGAIKAHDSNDRIIYDTTSHKLYYDDDGKDGHAAVQFAVLSSPVGTIDFTDFAVV